jgi:hypothetical protein
MLVIIMKQKKIKPGGAPSLIDGDKSLKKVVAVSKIYQWY